MIKLKELLNERYVARTSDTIEDVYQSAVDSLEDLSDLFKKTCTTRKTNLQHFGKTIYDGKENGFQKQILSGYKWYKK